MSVLSTCPKVRVLSANGDGSGRRSSTVEQRFCKPQVAGSIPVVGSSIHGGMAEWLMAPVCKIGPLTGYAGSNPAPTTSKESRISV